MEKSKEVKKTLVNFLLCNKCGADISSHCITAIKHGFKLYEYTCIDCDMTQGSNVKYPQVVYKYYGD